MPAQHLALPSCAQISTEDEAALSELYRRGTPANTLRAWERSLAYVAAWKAAVFGKPLAWPEEERVALRFVLDCCVDLSEKPENAQKAAMELAALGLRRDLGCPALATLLLTPTALRLTHEPVADCARLTIASGGPADMERTQFLDLMGALKLYGMRRAWVMLTNGGARGGST